ncbi:Beta-galactosidase [Rubripirellula amarantea]|uniref:Beta-galactosidase n=1 Tax=Rubripirellula amarantea TaxID=2527999 RepID=A0A5C5WXH0_9BACT|nr:sugar-binding domain-containing protein [Rubripirellula amarantea]TWT54959.1 Beta-galactosidase [Rubripirellula amarantea]
MRSLGLTFLFCLLCGHSLAEEVFDTWRYTLRRPAKGWQSDGFDDANWMTGQGGFGTRDTPGSRVGTIWATNMIWLRKSFRVDDLPSNPALLIHHDEDAEVFINGKSVAKLSGFATDYAVIPIPAGKRSVIKKGSNLMAVRCGQTGGGQFIDVHFVDADKVRQLPPPKRNTKPFKSRLITKWGEAVSADNAWLEYPRPMMRREPWVNLNGTWDYAITDAKEREIPVQWDGEILVPFCLESTLGGVHRLLDGSETLWYHRTFATDYNEDHRLILNFEAVDYRCEVFVNGTTVGSHQGGNTPFSIDITDAAKDGENDLVVRVEDKTDGYQLRGKQTLNARGIWYTQVSGIWQTVWLETVPQSHITDLKIKTDARAGEISIAPEIQGRAGVAAVRVVVKDNGEPVASLEGNANELAIKPANAKLWSPSKPHLYELEVSLLDSAGRTLDRVESYAGIRTVGKVKDKDGQWRFTLNGNPIFHWGPLDQGWWPDGLLTPPSDQAMLSDIQWLKDAGFNMIRKHIKVEPRRYYYHCDRIGMMVWQDQVSGGIGRRQGWPEWTRLKPDPVDAQWPAEQHKQFMFELESMITSLENHPSIVCWVPFNEAWGQHQTMKVGEWTSQRDPSRLVNVASGGNFWPVGDIVDEHRYPHPGFPFDLNTHDRFDNYIKVIGEFGGHGFPVEGHLWDAKRRNWGYGDIPKTKDEYKQRYVKSIDMLNDLRAQGIAAGVYTQTTDVEGEINGLMTYDRKEIKIPAAELAEIHQSLFQPITIEKAD